LPPVTQHQRYRHLAKFAAGGIDTGGKFATGVVDTGGDFAASVFVTGGKFENKNIKIFIYLIMPYIKHSSYSKYNLYLLRLQNVWGLMGTQARNILGTPGWALEGLYRG
jgi:hypothetical protein